MAMSKEGEDGNFTQALRSYTVEGSTRALRVAESLHGEVSTEGVLERCPALVLNSDYQPLSYTPLSVWSWQEAAKAVWIGKVTVVAEYSDRYIRSPSFEMGAPSVIALNRYQRRDLLKHPHFTRRNVYVRDHFTCQYCMAQLPPKALTYDHVVPKCRNGKSDWENVVTCCTICNNKKGDMDLDAFLKVYKDLSLHKKPKAPSHDELNAKAKRLPLYRSFHETWGDFVPSG